MTGLFLVVVAILLGFLGATMLAFGRSERDWEATLRWQRASRGAEAQVRGIQMQINAQALYALTGDPKYRREFDRGVAVATIGSRSVVAVGDPDVADASRSARRADLAHDRIVRAALFTAVRRGDHVAAAAGLTEASRAARTTYASTRRIAAIVDEKRTADVAGAKTEATQATVVGYASMVLALLIGAAAVVLLARADRRREEAECERERLLELTRDQNVALRRLDREKDEFIASVTHELRTPLTSIRGYVDLVKEEAGGRLHDDERHFLDVVERNGERLLHLVNDLLLVAQIQVGALKLDVTEVNLAATAREAAESARPAADGKGIELATAIDDAVVVNGDRIRLAQLLDNLLSNALKFTPPGGRVSVSAYAAGGTALVEVADSGIGMSPAEQVRLFERFYRTESATEQAIQGTGLGLAISKAIVESHGGSIGVESKPGVGTTFRVALPLAASPDRVPAPALVIERA